jgi:hypothetical protein
MFTSWCYFFNFCWHCQVVFKKREKMFMFRRKKKKSTRSAERLINERANETNEIVNLPISPQLALIAANTVRVKPRNSAGVTVEIEEHFETLTLSPGLAAIAANVVSAGAGNNTTAGQNHHHEVIDEEGATETSLEENSSSEETLTFTLSPGIAMIAANTVRVHQHATPIDLTTVTGSSLNSPVPSHTISSSEPTDRSLPSTDRQHETLTLNISPEIAARVAETVTIIPQATVISPEIARLPVVPAGICCDFIDTLLIRTPTKLGDPHGHGNG